MYHLTYIELKYPEVQCTAQFITRESFFAFIHPLLDTDKFNITSLKYCTPVLPPK